MGVYSSLEDNWYGFLDKVNEKLPVYKVIDPIDNIFPSFVLFLIIIVLILFLLTLGIFSSIGSVYQVEVVILTSNNLPVKDALIRAEFGSSEITIKTNEQGKAIFESKEKSILLNISKENYASIREIVDADKKHIFKLLPKVDVVDFEKKIVNVSVIDSAENIIPSAELDFFCDGNKEKELKKQGENGFQLEIENCQLVQLKARALGYEEKTITLNSFEERKIISLKRNVDEALIIFNVKNEFDEILQGADILIKDEFGSTKKNLLTNSFGEAETKLGLGEYSFVANYYGKSSSGNFEVTTKNLKEVNVIIYGATIINTNDLNSPSSNLKDLAFEVVDELNEAIVGAKIELFKDGNRFPYERSTGISGKTNPVKMSLDSSQYKAVVSSSNHEIKIVDVELQNIGNYQKIVLNKANTNVKINLINDTGAKEPYGIITIKNSQLNDPILTKTADANGTAVIQNLSPGTYTIFAIDKLKKAEAQEVINLSLNSNIEKNLMLITGSGKIKYYFVKIQGNKEVSAVPLNNFFIDAGEGFNSSNLLSKKTNYFETENLLVGVKSKVISNDEDFFEKESFTYTTQRNAQSKTTYLKEEDSLPNQNKLQLFIDQIYSSNPINGSETKATKIFAGQEYYLLFDLIINNEEQGALITNFSVNGNGTFIEEVISVGDYSRIMVENDENSGEDWSDEYNYVDEKAKQAKIIFENIQGKKAIPILLKISVDSNVSGDFVIKYNSEMNENQSLFYEKEFSIGDSFCINNCPAFAFDSFVVDKGVLVPVAPEGLNLFIENNYFLFTKIKNLSQEDFSNLKLVNSIAKNYEKYLSFENDSNKKEQTFNLPPLNEFQSTQQKLELKQSSTGFVQIKNDISKMEGQVDLLEDYDGTNTSIKFRLKRKEQLKVEIYPSTIEPGAVYPTFIVATAYTNYTKASADWRIMKLVGDEEYNVGDGYRGKTDENGLQVISFSAESLEEGDKIIIYAENEESIPAQKIIEVKRNVSLIELGVIDVCLSMNTGDPNNIIRLNLDESTNIILTETCGQEKRIDLISDVLLSEISFTLKANESKTITITGKIKDNILGVYPVRVFDKTLAKDIALVNVIINDPSSCFHLEAAIFDFRNDSKLSTRVTNKCFSGRQNNFYPKANITTNSVSLSYKKPGNPDFIDFNVHVIGSAMEGFFQSTIGSSQLLLTATGDSGVKAHKISGENVSELLCEYQSVFETHYYEGDYLAKPEPDLNITNPQIPLGRLPVPSDWRTTSVSTKEKKEQKISFATPITKGMQGTFPHGAASLPESFNWNRDGEGWNTGGEDALPDNQIITQGSHAIWAGWPIYFWSNADAEGRSATGNVGLPLGLVSVGACKNGFSKGLDNEDYDMHSEERWYLNAPPWFSLVEEGPGCYTVIETENCNESRCKINELAYLGGGIAFFDITVKGKTISRVGDSVSEYYCDTFGSQLNEMLNITGESSVNIGVEELEPAIDGSIQGGTNGAIAGAAIGTIALGLPGTIIGAGAGAQIGIIIGTINGSVCGAETAAVAMQFEQSRGSEVIIERKGYWNEIVKIPTTEKTITNLGAYLEATPTPEWTNFKRTPDGYAKGEGFAFPLSYFTVGDIHSNGFVDPERAITMNESAILHEDACVVGDVECEENLNYSSFLPLSSCEGEKGSRDQVCCYTKWIVRPPEDPLVEYDSSGKIMYYIPQDTIPGYLEGEPILRMFLKNGSVYAEYIGKPEIDSPHIDMNLSKNNLLGTEYAEIIVSDWISESEIKEQKFRVKLIGNETSCVSVEGKEGLTGKEFVPNVKFNWDWQKISINECDYTNAGSVYCDATQFTVSLFKKLREVELLLNQGRFNLVPEKTSFYVYLIKDNFNSYFLNDFDDYYSNTFANADTYFENGFDKFISQDRLRFDIDRTEETLLPYGGLYRVEIDLGNITLGINSLFEDNNPRNNIKITLTPVQKAPNYNPFYEMPFDGMVGYKNGQFVRNDYGLSSLGDELKLDTITKTNSFQNSLSKIIVSKTNSPRLLDQGYVLKLNLTQERLELLASQPNPIIMQVDSKGGNIVSKYNWTNNSEAVNKKWNLEASTLGNIKCLDLSGEDNRKLFETISKQLSWENAKAGKIWLGSVFFTPKSNTMSLTPSNENITKFFSNQRMNNSSAMLDNYDNQGITDYDTLQGIFDKVANEEMCISKNNENEVNIWWNPEYLQEIINEILPKTATKCS